MIGLLVVLSLFVSGAIYSMFYPILLPDEVIDALTDILTPVFALDGMIPITEIFNCVNWTITILLVYLIYRLIMGLLGLITGGGTPDLE